MEKVTEPNGGEKEKSAELLPVGEALPVIFIEQGGCSVSAALTAIREEGLADRRLKHCFLEPQRMEMALISPWR